MPDSKPVTRSELQHDLEAWSSQLKQSLSAVEGRLDEHTQILSDIAGTLKEIRQELRAVTGLYRRLDHRDQVFAAALKINLRAVDAKYVPSPPS